MLENLNSAIDFIREQNLLVAGDKVGVGVSGGSDSMALLHLLQGVAENLEIEIVAVNVNHKIRQGSRKDSIFVSNYCKANDIAYVGFNCDVPAYAQANKIGIEQAAREKRYECFETAIKKHKLTKFALAHHQSDQAETILLHIFRGSGIGGAAGMDARRGVYIRPFLSTPKTDIIAYNYLHQVPHVTDESNEDNTYARNLIRNEIMPRLQQEWRNVEKSIITFGENCRTDDKYISSLVNDTGLLQGENNIRIPLNYFAYPYSIVSRLLLTAFDKLGERTNIEKKHLDMVYLLATTGENGSKMDLPNNLYAIREYEYITIVRKVEAVRVRTYSFRTGKTQIDGFGTILVTKTISHKLALGRGLMVVDADKVSKSAKWRMRKDGDMFTKFGGGTKALGAYMIDQKIPARLRDRIPVLAIGNEILAIAGLEISEKVKTDRDTLEAYVIEIARE
jgi:tRNA(Ile)-lysidine synthase